MTHEKMQTLDKVLKKINLGQITLYKNYTVRRRVAAGSRLPRYCSVNTAGGMRSPLKKLAFKHKELSRG